jgi:integrase
LKFKKLTAWYLELPDVKSLKSYRRAKCALDQFNNSFGESFVCDIKKEDLQKYQKAREGQGAADATIDMEISIAQTMVTNAFDNDKVDGRALKAFRSVKRKLKAGANARKGILTTGEYLRLLDKAQSHLKPILIIAFNTAMRRGEILGLKWSNIDADGNFIRLSEDMTKEHREKSIPINQHVREVLNKIPRPIHHNFVFTYHGKPINIESGIKKSFKKACKEAGILYGLRVRGGTIFHDIRRTVKTNMLQAGIEKEYRDMILGHSLKGMDRHYIKPTEETLIQAMERYTKWFDEQILIEIGNSDQTSDQKQKRS